MSGMVPPEGSPLLDRPRNGLNGPRRCALAARIVRETACPYCMAPAGVLCRRGSTHLSPSAAHRARLGRYWEGRS